MNRGELEKIVNHLQKYANQRLNALKKEGLQETPAYQARRRKIDDEHIYFDSGENPTIQRLKEEYKSVRLFLELSTSSVKGAKKWQEETAKRFESYSKSEITNYEKMWDVVNRVDDYFRKFRGRVLEKFMPSSTVHEMADISVSAGYTVDEAVELVIKEIDRLENINNEEDKKIYDDDSDSFFVR